MPSLQRLDWRGTYSQSSKRSSLLLFTNVISASSAFLSEQNNLAYYSEAFRMTQKYNKHVFYMTIDGITENVFQFKMSLISNHKKHFYF
jgi:hypothetical protein